MTLKTKEHNMNCDEHFTWVACNPKLGPGAYACCTADSEYEKYAKDFRRREQANGATVKRVTCNDAHAMLDEYLAWIDAERDEKGSK